MTQPQTSGAFWNHPPITTRCDGNAARYEWQDVRRDGEGLFYVACPVCGYLVDVPQPEDAGSGTQALPEHGWHHADLCPLCQGEGYHA